jgi:DNA-binding IclR family transcriptional regulator
MALSVASQATRLNPDRDGDVPARLRQAAAALESQLHGELAAEVSASP